MPYREGRLATGDRLTHPLIRRNGQLEQASWDEALDYMAKRFREIQNKYGNDATDGEGSGTE